jgi:hypothetical protein
MGKFEKEFIAIGINRDITNEFAKASAFSANVGGVEAVAQIIADEVE